MTKLYENKSNSSMTTNPAVEIDLDKQRAEFEAAFNLDEFRKMRRVLDSTKYQHEGTQSAWEGWQAAQARASQAVAEPVAWISVKDRLPEPWDGKRFSKSVLIVDMDSSYPHVRMSELNFDDEGPTVWSGADPTHWRPAPALPGSLAAPVAQQSERTPGSPHDVCRGIEQGLREYIAKLEGQLVAQQSEAGAPIYQVATKHGYAWADVDREVFDSYTSQTGYNRRIVCRADQPVKAGAPTAAADLQGAFDHWMHSRLFANPPQSVTPYDAFVAGRESAAPEAKQDAKGVAAKIVRDVCELDYTGEDWDAEKMLSVTVEDLELIAERAIDAAMQKGASNG